MGLIRLKPCFDMVAAKTDGSLLHNDFLHYKVPEYIGKGIMNEDYTPRFTSYEDTSYRSCFGPYFTIPGIYTPGTGPEEHRVAMMRLLEQREPDKPGFSDRLRSNQSKIRRRLRNELYRFKQHLHSNYVDDHPDHQYDVWLKSPSPKKKLRVRANSSWLQTARMKRKGVGYKLKRHEPLAKGKQRGIGDLGVERTQETAFCIPNFKEAWSVPYVSGEYKGVFVASPDKGVLSNIFKELWNSSETVFVYFSDDSCFGCNCSDGRLVFNADIKKCDNSHFDPIFEMLFDLLAYDPRGLPVGCYVHLVEAFAFLNEKPTMRNTKEYREKIKYHFNSARLFSGSVLTTIINNFANWLIFMHLKQLVPHTSNHTKAEIMRAYVKAGEMAGYVTKVQICNIVEDMQFLKHSCSEIDGEYVPWMNLGVFYRMFGTFVGDLPGRGSIFDRASSFVSDVVVGRENWGNHVVNDSFMHLVVSKNIRMTGNAYREALTVKSIGRAEKRIREFSLCKRYGITESDLGELCELTSQAGVFDFVSHPILAVIYLKDYG